MYSLNVRVGILLVCFTLFVSTKSWVKSLDHVSGCLLCTGKKKFCEYHTPFVFFYLSVRPASTRFLYHYVISFNSLSLPR
ncbi:hypothetical protein EJ05DRAFT_326534 [Pseudovirgaria hyperparasitica]|uniref:Secreted protein n=1 Tax=Pseudovirgaria hyperparasitica TaxID=470096 RepID=A0A6A6W8P7_9PEZI|nr:uncharacterized protein EJ05DRAFT_326534 [Pseudovirgaria hyperparasitica]KAF2758925.1 hypothetical protein EJ05DRAFT_326534 [Pseudovirgaria hyperparasitica]